MDTSTPLLPPTDGDVPVRFRRMEDHHNLVPVHVVWEITLACNLKCQHCGSRAGRPRADELTTAEALDLVDQLAALGTREMTLIGGRPICAATGSTSFAAAASTACAPPSRPAPVT
ncbi:radical SAM protein [Nitrospirillum sp. BR 11163]|nr:radical SAM protein [Nitrospirillum sp. BR 11163]